MIKAYIYIYLFIIYVIIFINNHLYVKDMWIAQHQTVIQKALKV